MAVGPLQRIVQNQAYRIVFWQLAGVIALACVMLPVAGIKSSLSVLAGGMAYGLPNLIFVWRVFRYAGAQQMDRFVMAFFFGEAIKLVLSGFLIVLVVKYLPVSLSSVLTGFAGAIVLFWFVCMWQFSRQRTGVAG